MSKILLANKFKIETANRHQSSPYVCASFSVSQLAPGMLPQL